MAPTEIISSACVRIVLHTIRFTLYGPCSESCGAIFLKTNYPWIRMITQFLKCTDKRFHKKYGVFAPETSFIYFYFLSKFLLECSFGASHVALVVKSMPASAADAGSVPGSGSSSGKGNGCPLQYSCLENPMDGGAWWATVHGAKGGTGLSG